MRSVDCYSEMLINDDSLLLSLVILFDTLIASRSIG